MGGLGLQVQEARTRPDRRRFLELGHRLHAGDRRWAPPVVGYERARLDVHRNPALAEAEVTWLVVRRGGDVVGRAVAYLWPAGVPPTTSAGGLPTGGWGALATGANAGGSATGGAGAGGAACVADRDRGLQAVWASFGSFEAADGAVADLLLEALATRARRRGAGCIVGPLLHDGDRWDPGTLVVGHDVAGTTGRPWHPLAHREAYERAGLSPVGPPHPSWRWELGAEADHDVDEAAEVASTEVGEGPLPAAVGRLGPAGAYRDARLWARAGTVVAAAVPDLASTGAQDRPLRLARLVRAGGVEACTVVSATHLSATDRTGGPPVDGGRARAAVAALGRRAAALGYRAMVAPVPPVDGSPPEAVHQVFGRVLAADP